jgi:tripartite-type tricarboxylate transporter receptor subunit TctC
MRRRELLSGSVSACLAPGLAACRRAAGVYPSHPIRLLVPFTVGSGTDREARDVVQYLRPHLRVPVVLENEAGADGSTAISRLARAIPDCYLLAYYGIPSMILTEVLSDVPYRIRDFSHIFAWIRESLVLVVRPGRWASFDSFLAEGRRRRLTAAVPYLTSTGRLAGLLLARETGLRCGWIPFGGSNAALAAVLGGHVDFSIAVTATCLPPVRAGELAPVLIFADTRDAMYPNVPTPAELGYRVPALPIVRGVVAPPGAAAQPLRVLEQAFFRATQDPAFLRHARQTGTPVFPLSSAAYRREVETCYHIVEPLRRLMLEDARR